MNIHVLEMPLDFGGNRHGSDMGPSAIRLAGLKEELNKQVWELLYIIYSPRRTLEKEE